MISFINQERIIFWLNKHPSVKQWLWFVGLWCFGLLSVFLITYPIKFLMRSLSTSL